MIHCNVHIEVIYTPLWYQYMLLYPVLEVNSCPRPPQIILTGTELLSVDYR